jgi:hypothetical protein
LDFGLILQGGKLGGARRGRIPGVSPKQLTEYDAERWRATFYVTAAAHSIVGGSA